MDLEDWELLPDDGLLQIHDDGGKKIFSRKLITPYPENHVFNMNYFICNSPKSPPQFVEKTEHDPRLPKQLVPVPIHLDLPPVLHDHEPITEIKDDPVEKFKSCELGRVQPDQDPVSQVFFKKMKEPEFADMKMDSPRSGGGTRGIAAQNFGFEGKGEILEGGNEMVVKDCDDVDEKVGWEVKSGGLNLWNWSLTGIGAICSFGVAAAATICIIFIGSRRSDGQHRRDHKIRVQIYADDKRIKQVVQHATKLNESISTGRGFPPARAHITVGGHYDGL